MTDKKIVWSDLLGYLGVLVVALLYIGTAMFVPTASGKSIGTIIADGALGLALGVAINFNLNLQGILKGKSAKQIYNLHARAKIALKILLEKEGITHENI